MLGMCYLGGYGNIEEDPKNAFLYFKLAADQGFVPAQFEVGECYDLGIGVDEDKKMAFHYYKRAADQSYPEALYFIGLEYEYGGEVVEKNLGKALEYYHKAAALGNTGAQDSLSKLEAPTLYPKFRS